MKTLLNGACFEYNMDPRIENPFIKNDYKIETVKKNIKEILQKIKK